MKELKEYLFKTGPEIIDCHVHLFGKHGLLKYDKPYDGMVVMVENTIIPQDTDKPLTPYFDKYVPQVEKMLDGKQWYLCGVGKDFDETRELFDKYNFDAIGEVKCLKHYKYNGKEYTHEEFSIQSLVSLYHKPMFIHWDLFDDDSAESLDNILYDYPDEKIILCHCGLNDIDNWEDAFNRAIKLQANNTNLWLEISWVTLKFLIDNPLYINKIPCPDHTIVGVDMSGSAEVKDNIDTDERYSYFKTIYKRFNVPQTLKNLFSDAHIPGTSHISQGGQK